MNLIDIISKNSRNYPNEIAFVEVRPVTKGRTEIRWSDFDIRVKKIANILKEMGVKQGDRVLLLGRNSVSWLEVYFGVLRAGAWITPLNFRFTDDDIAYCATVAEPVVFFCDEEFAQRVNALKPKLPTIRRYISLGTKKFDGTEALEDLIERTPPLSHEVEMGDEDACGLYFTSGTTGTPKPILLTHKSLFSSGITEMAHHLWRHPDSFLMIPPLYHSAIGHVFGPMIVGARTVFLTETVTPRDIFETMSGEKISVVFLLVPWAMDILGALDRGELKLEGYHLSGWRLMHMGAQPIPPTLIQKWKAYFPEMQYDTSYGLTECSGPGVTNLGIGNERKIASIGKPGLMWDVRIVDDQAEDVPQGQVGEIIARGNGMMKEYYKNPALTAQTIQNGWLFTGDMGRIDEEGFVYIVDRKKDLVISGGENIYPVEIEQTLLKHPGVRDAAVIGTPDDRLGEVVTAIVEPSPGKVLTEEELKLFCEQHLPRYKRPRTIFFDTIPRSPTGKTEKVKLRAKYRKK